MRICRYKYEGEAYTGIIEDKIVKEAQGNFYNEIIATGQTHSFEEINLLSPSSPTKIVAIGVNYKVHAKYGYKIPDVPLIFLKPPSAVVGHNSNIVFPASSRQVDFEGELGVVIGGKAEHVSVDEADNYILGYTCANDVTARDIQNKEGHFGRAKGFNTFAPVGPWIETDLDPANILLETYLNGQRKQSSNTSDMAFSVPEIVAFVSGIMTLLPGDIIITGTPDGMGPMSVGDTVEVKIEGIGTLRNTVVGPDDGLESRQEQDEAEHDIY
jgi:2-keto-4-pentenoate hydratase/2-oxohepta-3-ene-1,7-dioic acid hydratase in catechol pathway